MPKFLDDIYVEYQPAGTTTSYLRKAILPPVGFIGNKCFPVCLNMGAVASNDPDWYYLPMTKLLNYKTTSINLLVWWPCQEKEMILGVADFASRLNDKGFSRTSENYESKPLVAEKTYPVHGFILESQKLHPLIDAWGWKDKSLSNFAIAYRAIKDGAVFINYIGAGSLTNTNFNLSP